jgi:hypothetical protein
MSTHSFLPMHVMLDHWTCQFDRPLCHCAAFVPLWYCPRKNTTLLSQKISKGFKRLQQGRRSQLTDWFAAKLRWCKSNTGHKIDPERMLLHSEWATATQHQQPFDILSQRCRNIWRQRIGCNMLQCILAWSKVLAKPPQAPDGIHPPVTLRSIPQLQYRHLLYALEQSGAQVSWQICLHVSADKSRLVIRCEDHAGIWVEGDLVNNLHS